MTAEELQAVIDRLTREIGDLQQRNLTLQARLDQLLAPAKSPDDVASALQRTVDRLQTELASLSNPISNFAVKDFRLETALTVSITELGTIEYRLLQPGSNVDPNSISKLTLSLVPIEKQGPGGTLSSLLFQPGRELALVGLGDELREVFERNHIFTIGDFRSTVMRAQVRATLIASEKATQQELALFQARAELLLLAGIDRISVDLLITAGVDSLQALARSTPEGLMLILPKIDKAQLAQWIAAAQAFTGIAPAEPATSVLKIDTRPAGLLARLETDETFSPTPIQRQLASSTRPFSLGTLRHQLTESGTGYALDAWSTGSGSAATTVVPSSNSNATAGFRVACHSVTASTLSPGGRLELSPPVGGVEGFPASCYAPGTNVRLSALPDEGYRLDSLVITTGMTAGTTRPTRTLTEPETEIVVDAPVLARATFVELIGDDRTRGAAEPPLPGSLRR